MGKYLSAELYKMTHRRSYTFGMLGLVLGGEALMLFLLKTARFSNATTYDDVIGVLPLTLTVGIYLVPAICDIIFSDQYKLNTLKNEMAYGTPRLRVYFGKLLASVITAVAFCAIFALFYMGAAALLFPVKDAASTAAAVEKIGKSLAVALPVWLGALSFVHMLLFVMKGSVSAVVLYLLTLSLGDILELMSLFLPKLQEFCGLVQRCLIGAPMDTVMNGSFNIPYAWTVGTVWFVVCAIVGDICFQKREIS